MTKTILTRADLIDIDRVRGKVPAEWVKTKYKIGTRRLNNLWSRDVTLETGTEICNPAVDNCTKKVCGRPKGTKNPDKSWAKDNNWENK